MNDVERLFSQRITWEEQGPESRWFHALVNGETCTLRMNDFPDEPLYTLTFRGQSVDFDNRPAAWIMPWMKK